MFNEEEISKHNKEDDCWIIINGVVYDVTQFLSTHPVTLTSEKYEPILRVYLNPPSSDSPFTVHVSRLRPHPSYDPTYSNIRFFNSTWYHMLINTLEGPHKNNTSNNDNDTIDNLNNNNNNTNKQSWHIGDIQHTFPESITILPWDTLFYQVEGAFEQKPTSFLGRTLTGMWKGDYSSHGWEIVYIYVKSAQIFARKLTGDGNVPAGEITWQANIPALANRVNNENSGNNDTEDCYFGVSYEGEGRTALHGFISPNWNRGVLTLRSPTSLSFNWMVCILK